MKKLLFLIHHICITIKKIEFFICVMIILIKYKIIDSVYGYFSLSLN